MAINGFSYTVSWSDFTVVQARPPGVPEDAQIHTEIRPGKFTLGRKGRSVTITDVDIEIALVAADCWVLSSQNNNNDLLKHEQGHYDIVALNAKELYRSLVGLSAASTHALQIRATKLQKSLQRKVTKVNASYDTLTNHSRNTTTQQIWDQKIIVEKQKPDGSTDNLPS